MPRLSIKNAEYKTFSIGFLCNFIYFLREFLFKTKVLLGIMGCLFFCSNIFSKEIFFEKPFDGLPLVYQRLLYGYEQDHLLVIDTKGNKQNKFNHSFNGACVYQFNVMIEHSDRGLEAFDVKTGFSLWKYTRSPVAKFEVSVPYILFQSVKGIGVLDFYTGQELWVKPFFVSMVRLEPGLILMQDRAYLTLFSPSRATVIKKIPIKAESMLLASWSTGCLLKEGTVFKSVDFGSEKVKVMPFKCMPMVYFRKTMAILSEPGVLKRVSLVTGQMDILKDIPTFSNFWLSDPYLILKTMDHKIRMYDLEKWELFPINVSCSDRVKEPYVVFWDHFEKSLYRVGLDRLECLYTYDVSSKVKISAQ